MAHNINFDTIIVGAGAAGCVLAARLSESRDHRVLLLESGPDFPATGKLPTEIRQAYGYTGIWGQAFGYATRYGWNYRGRSTDNNPNMFIPRGRIIGGSSAVNAQIFLRGLPEDYDGWAAAGNREWAYDKILPCLQRIESDRDFDDDFHGAEGPIPVRRFAPAECSWEHLAFDYALRDRGMPECPDHNDPHSTGVGPLPLNNADGIRWSAALGYLTPNTRTRANLRIRSDCHVSRVIIEQGRAVAVEILSESGPERICGHEIIASGGAIGSPHLLLRSGIGPTQDLRSLGIRVHAEGEGVGYNLRCHAQCGLTVQVKQQYRNTGEEPPIQIGCRYTATGSELRNDMFLHPGSGATRQGYYDAGDTDIVGFFLVCAIYLASGSGHLRLRSPKSENHPILDYNLLRERSDLDRMREGVRMLLDLLKHAEYRDRVDGPTNMQNTDPQSDADLDRWMHSVVATSHHVSGTCKMGPENDPMAVVDQFGKVRGIDGLRVADASIMHDCIRANTNLTTMMIGERVAEFINSGR